MNELKENQVLKLNQTIILTSYKSNFAEPVANALFTSIFFFVVTIELQQCFKPWGFQHPFLTHLVLQMNAETIAKQTWFVNEVSDLETFMDYLALPGWSCENLNFSATSPYDILLRKLFVLTTLAFQFWWLNCFGRGKKIKSQLLHGSRKKSTCASVCVSDCF